MIEALLLAAVMAPLALALALALRVVGGEREVARVAQGAAAFSAAASLVAIASWLAGGARPLLTPARVLFEHGRYRFAFDFVLDANSVVFLILVQFTTGMVLRFSRFYLHREPGFRRFFATVLMFQAAMCVLTLAGNLDVMFAGWEAVGVASFLLIAFYWERPSAVRNALKTYSVYRVADAGMLLAACSSDAGDRRAIGLLVLLAAIGKSAQFPFSFWVPRAMEGPTPSSALFYGALSVHAGAYLLLRTAPVWGDVTSVRVCIGAVGLLTATLCWMFGRVQPTIKAQVGYASVTQVGLVFVELALGLRALALVHIVSNALLRCYELLVSPSIVAYRVRQQASAGSARAGSTAPSDGRGHAMAAALYVFALSEGYLKEAVKGAIWSPLRRLGRVVLPRRATLLAAGVAALAAFMLTARRVPQRWDSAAGWVLIALAVLCSGSGLGSWRKPLHTVAWVSASSLSVAAAAFVISPAHDAFAGAVYAGAIAMLGGMGLVGTSMVARGGAPISRFAGLCEGRPLATALVLVSVLGIAGFPLLPTFLGEDLLFFGALRVSGAASAVMAGVLALNGYLAVRNFAFTFLGQRRAEELGRRAADHGRLGGAALEEWAASSRNA